MSDSRFDSCALAEELMFFPALVITVFPAWNIWYQYLSAINLLLSPVPSVSGQFLNFLSCNAFHLQERFLDGMPVILVPEGLGAQDYPSNRADDRNLVAELIFLMLFPLADTLHIWFMQRINFILGIDLLGKHHFIEIEQRVVVVIVLQVASQFPEKPSGDGVQTLVCFQSFFAIFRMIAEALVTKNTLKNVCVGLTQRKVQGFCNRQHIAHYLFMQLRIRRKCYVLFLYRGVDESRVVMIPMIILLVDSDTF